MRLVMYDPEIVVWQSPGWSYPFQLHRHGQSSKAPLLFAVNSHRSTSLYPDAVDRVRRP